MTHEIKIFFTQQLLTIKDLATCIEKNGIERVYLPYQIIEVNKNTREKLLKNKVLNQDL
ncbi:MAG: hypothetical protein MUF15_03385 [Acidobacteria bacterium]|jgi:hypothetical protein|nr:hypothetical protein [Acidobacteriota bacterium]